MYDKAELCRKIIQTYPSIGQCGIDLKVEYDNKAESWAVFMEKGGREVKHFLPKEDADACMRGEQCAGLGLEIAQFRHA